MTTVHIPPSLCAVLIALKRLGLLYDPRPADFRAVKALMARGYIRPSPVPLRMYELTQLGLHAAALALSEG